MKSLFTKPECLLGAESGHWVSVGSKHGLSWYPVVIPACNKY